jgi:predicted MFS family arabinose efflux permease
MVVASAIRGVVRDQSAAVWVLQLGILVNFFGNGLVAPFLVLYLHFGRGLPIPVAAGAIAAGGVTAVASGLLAGWSADRFGPKPTVVGAMLSNSIAYALYLGVSEAWSAVAVALLVGFGTGMYGPSSQSLVAALVPAELRHRVFTQNRMFALLGLGAGGIVGGLIAAGERPSDYERLLTIDVVTFLAFAGVLALIPLPSSAVTSARTAGPGYVAALRDRALVRLCIINLALVSAGIAPMLVLMPAYAKLHGGVGEGSIGLIYAANTMTILLFQIPITRSTEGRRRMPRLAAGATLWIVAWLVMLAGAWSGTFAVLLIGLAVVTYGIGECLYSAVMIPTVAAIAPDRLRGRYLAIMGFSWQGGFLLGPAIGGTLLTLGPAALPLACAVTCGAAAIAALAVERLVPAEHRDTPRVVATDRRPLVKWITREHPRVDRVACPWLIERFIDPKAEFLYVPSAEVLASAERVGATPYDVAGVDLGHHGDECSFDAFVARYDLAKDRALVYMARVIRGADTANKSVTPESIGVEALLAGIRALHHPDDQAQRLASYPVLDALYAYCKANVAG